MPAPTTLELLILIKDDLHATKCFATADATNVAISQIHELINVASGVIAAIRCGKEPDLIALADAVDDVGGKEKRKEIFRNLKEHR